MLVLVEVNATKRNEVEVVMETPRVLRLDCSVANGMTPLRVAMKCSTGPDSTTSSTYASMASTTVRL